MNNEKSILNKLQLFASSLNARLFRNNNGLAYTGQAIRQPNGDILLRNPRPIKYGLGVGTGDLFGGTQIIITPDMVGRKVFVVTNYEVKTKNTKTSKEQIAFHNMVNALGGISIIDRFENEDIKGNSYRESIDKFQGSI